MGYFLNKFKSIWYSYHPPNPVLTVTDDTCDILQFHNHTTNNLSMNDTLIKCVSPHFFNTNLKLHKPITAYIISDLYDTNNNISKFISTVEIPTNSALIINDKNIFGEDVIETNQYKLIDTDHHGFREVISGPPPGSKGIMQLCVFQHFEKVNLDVNKYVPSFDLKKSNTFGIVTEYDILLNMYYKIFKGGYQCYLSHDEALKRVKRSHEDIYLYKPFSKN